jgi:hypothetical protein
MLMAAWLCLSLFPTQLRADALSDLDKAFRDAYSVAASQILAKLRAQAPVLVNRFGQIALYRPDIEQPEIYSMDMKLYLEARAVAHAAVALTARIAAAGLGPLDMDSLDWLDKYRTLLSAAETELTGREDVPKELKAIQLDLLASVRQFVQRIQQRGEIEQPTLDEIGLKVRDGIGKNLNAAAASQLGQFRTQIERWKVAYPSLRWNSAVVVVIGIHQARDNYLQTQFFDWMLDDKPTNEDRVVFAETLAPPAPLDKEPALDAMILLSKVMLDKTIASIIFGDPLALQSDVLGKSARTVIQGWSRSSK